MSGDQPVPLAGGTPVPVDPPGPIHLDLTDLPGDPVNTRPQHLVLEFCWDQNGQQWRDIYGPWIASDDDAHLAAIQEFVIDWQRLTGIKPTSVMLTLVVDPVQWVRGRKAADSDGG
jgi:hypothetical protein